MQAPGLDRAGTPHTPRPEPQGSRKERGQLLCGACFESQEMGKQSSPAMFRRVNATKKKINKNIPGIYREVTEVSKGRREKKKKRGEKRLETRTFQGTHRPASQSPLRLRGPPNCTEAPPPAPLMESASPLRASASFPTWTDTADRFVKSFLVAKHGTMCSEDNINYSTQNHALAEVKHSVPASCHHEGKHTDTLKTSCL